MLKKEGGNNGLATQDGLEGPPLLRSKAQSDGGANCFSQGERIKRVSGSVSLEKGNPLLKYFTTKITYGEPATVIRIGELQGQGTLVTKT